MVVLATVLALASAGGCSSGDGGVDWTSRSGNGEPGERPTDPGDPPPDPVDPDPLDPELGPEPFDPELSRSVLVNGVGLDEATLAALEQELGWAIADGAYWYDPVLGAVGIERGPTAGFLPAGLAIGGSLTEDASSGDSGVYVNGRELPLDDLVALEQLFLAPIPPARYFLDAAGYYGYEGDLPLGNVFDTLAQQQSTGVNGGGGGFVEETAGGWIGGSGDDSYYFDPSTGCSVMAGDGVSC